MAREFRSLGANLLVTPNRTRCRSKSAAWITARWTRAPICRKPTSASSRRFSGGTIFSDSRRFSMCLLCRSATGGATTLIGTWYDHEVAVPDGTTFKTGVSVTHPWWKIQGRWFSDGANECVVGASLAAKYPGAIAIGKPSMLRRPRNSSDIRPLVVTGIVSTGDAEDDAISRAALRGAGISGSSGPIPPAFRERADETRRRSSPNAIRNR